MKIIIFMLFSLTALAQSRIDSQFSFREIAPDTFVVTDETYHYSNVLVAKLPDQTVLIASSPFETQGTKVMVKWIKATFSPKKIVAINTHHHFDGTGGNEAYAEAGVEIWASDLTNKLLDKIDEKLRKDVAEGFKGDLKERILKAKTVKAPNVFPLKAGKKFSFGQEEVQVIFPGAAHAQDNVVVFLPKRKVMFGGCMIRPEDSLGFTGDADLKAWPASAESLLKLDLGIVIPGHGLKLGDRKMVESTIQTAKKTKK